MFGGLRFIILYCFLSTTCRIESFSTASRKLKSLLYKAVPEWLTDDGDENSITEGTIRVRFINTVNKKDVVVDGVKEGANLLAIGDSAGVKLPRACRTGLCGSCVCEVKDPAAVASPSNPRAGFAVLRACSTKCFVPEGQDEMVVDVYRMQKKKTPQGLSPEELLLQNIDDFETESDMSDAMARFSDDWELDFKPNWELSSDAVGAGKKACNRCAGTGRVECYACNGAGSLIMSDKTVQCLTCVGLQNVGCGYCNGSGVTSKSKRHI